MVLLLLMAMMSAEEFRSKENEAILLLAAAWAAVVMAEVASGAVKNREILLVMVTMTIAGRESGTEGNLVVAAREPEKNRSILFAVAAREQEKNREILLVARSENGSSEEIISKVEETMAAESTTSTTVASIASKSPTKILPPLTTVTIPDLLKSASR